MLTVDNIVAILGCPIERAQRWVDPINAAMSEFGIDAPARAAAFIAQIGCESDRLHYVREIWGPTPAQLRYEGRTDLGNTTPGDGIRFMGRGLMQTTGRKNYKLCGDALGIDLVEHPELLEHPETAARAAAWFWRTGAGLNLGHGAHLHGVDDGCDLNDFADTGDFDSITYAINGGLNGQPLRLSLWAVAKRELGA